MASPYPQISSILPGHPFEQPPGVYSHFPYPLRADAASTSFVQQIDSMGVHNSPFFRIATLEKELAQALSEKAAAEHAAHYIMKVSACQWQSLGQHAENIKDPKVNGEIRSLTTEVADLRKRLLEMTVFLETALRDRKTADLEKKFSVCPSCTQSSAGIPRLFPEPATKPVDLLGLDNDENLELCQSANSEDGLDELARFTQLPPKIDFGSGEKEAAQVAAGDDRHNSLPQIDSPLVRHFEPTAAETSNLSDIVDQSGFTKQGCFTDKPTAPLRSQSPFSESRPSKPCRFMNQVLAGRVYPTRPVERPQRRQPRNTDPRVNSWLHSSRESSEAYAKAGEATVDDLLGNCVTEDIKASHSRVYVGLENTHGISGVEDAKISKNSNNCALEQVFENASELHNPSVLHRRYAGRDNRQIPEFFRYGVRFQPSPAMSNTFQTLSFMNLPPSVTMQELIAKIRGGIVVSCQLLDTTSITGSLSARVRFLQESAALAYDNLAAANPIILHGQKAHVSIVRTPTFPLSSSMLEKIIQGGRTRCLEISNISKDITATRLLRDLKISSMQTTGIEHMQMRKNRVLDLRFSSIWHAERAYAKLVSFRVYRCCGVSWARDPCALPLNAMNESAEADRSGIVPIEKEFVGERKCDAEKTYAAEKTYDAEKPCDVTHMIHGENNDNKVDNKVGIQHHNGSTARSISLSRSAESISTHDFLSQPTSSQTTSSFETALIFQPSTKHTSLFQPTETKASPDETKTIYSQPKMDSLVSNNNQLSDSMWATPSRNLTTTKQSFIMSAHLKQDAAPSSTSTSPDVGQAIFNYFTDAVAEDLEPLSQSRWAPSNMPAKKPAATRPPQLQQDTAPSSTSTSADIGKAIFDYFTDDVAEDLEPLSQSRWAPSNMQAKKPATTRPNSELPKPSKKSLSPSSNSPSPVTEAPAKYSSSKSSEVQHTLCLSICATPEPVAEASSGTVVEPSVDNSWASLVEDEESESSPSSPSTKGPSTPTATSD